MRDSRLKASLDAMNLRWAIAHRIHDPEAPPPAGYERDPKTRRLVAVGVRIGGRWRTGAAAELVE